MATDVTELTQTDLNTGLRGLSDVDILMFLPDKNITFGSNAVTSNVSSLSYTTKLQSVIELSSLPQANLATFENNSWILDGSFISPTESYGTGGDSYTGYISNDMTDDNGNYTTNPILTVTFANTAPIVNYISVRFAGGINTSYPKTFKIRTYNENDTLIKEHSVDLTGKSGLPLLVSEIEDNSVKKVEFEFVGTQCPHRRSRLNKILFGKVEQVDNYYLQSWKVDDKASLVADSIPTKTLEYSIINYTGDYDIDNPGNKIPTNYNDVSILFTFSMEQNGLWKYAPTKVFNLLDISTSSDGLVTFKCGSILDMLTETYDHDTFDGPKTISEIMKQLLTFSGVSTDQCELNEFGSYNINVPLPESPVREIIQKLAFSCGATLTVDDNNRIIFSQKNIIPNESTPKFMFDLPEPFNSAGVLLEEPRAEALANTTNIAMYTYGATIDNEASDIGSASVASTNPVKVTYSAISGTVAFNNQSLSDQHATLARVDEIYSQHAIITLTWDSNATPPIEVKMTGRKVTTSKSLPKNVDQNTLLLDSGLASVEPNNLIKPSSPDNRIFYYTDWYGAKFKYVCKTRNEYLIHAGDIIYFETPFSNGKPTRVGYVLRNSYSDSEESGGEMEVIVIGNN